MVILTFSHVHVSYYVDLITVHHLVLYAWGIGVISKIQHPQDLLIVGGITGCFYGGIHMAPS